MKGFKLVCKECGKEIEFDISKYLGYGEQREEDIKIWANNDGAIDEITCVCGNKIIW